MFLELRKLHRNGAIRGYQLGGKWLQTKDDEIIELYWKRDPKAIEETQTHYGEKLGRLSFGILENREDAQECVNDTYLRTWNSIPPTRNGRRRTCNPGFTITRNTGSVALRL